MTQTNPEWWNRSGDHPVGPQQTGGYPAIPPQPPAPTGWPTTPGPFPGAAGGPHAVPPPAGRPALIIMGVCGLVALMSYFALPAISTPFGSMSMSTALSLVTGLSGRGSGLTGLIVVAMLVIAGCGFFGALGSLRARSVAAGIGQVPAVLLLLCYLLLLTALFGEANSSSSMLGRAGASIALSVLGAGFYLTLFALLGAIIAGAIAHRDVRSARRAGW